MHAVLVEETQKFCLLSFLEETKKTRHWDECRHVSVAQCAKKKFVWISSLHNKKHSTKLNSNSVIVDTYFLNKSPYNPSPCLVGLLTLVEASMFSGSMRVLSSPISWTAPPNSGSESQIICLITTFISKTSCKQKKQMFRSKDSLENPCTIKKRS